MYLCVCFFFKQKTAYEMRISDWSSDVCSSDLFLARPALPDDQHRPVEFGGAPGLLDRIQKGQRLADELGIFLHAQLMVKFPTFRQIGRASCRESVCQYV